MADGWVSNRLAKAAAGARDDNMLCGLSNTKNAERLAAQYLTIEQEH